MDDEPVVVPDGEPVDLVGVTGDHMKLDMATLREVRIGGLTLRDVPIAFGDLNYIVGQVLGKFEMSVLAAVLILMMRMVRTGSVAAETVPARF